MGLLYLVRIHKAKQVVGELPDGEGRFAPRCFAVPSGVYGVDMKMTGKLIHLPLEIVTVLTVAMEENQCIALTLFYKEMLYVHRYYFTLTVI